MEQNSLSIAQRCLCLTGSLETTTAPPACYSGVAGDFDGMGMSYGALQWNLGQGTLQPLFSDMMAANPGVMATVFGDNLTAFQDALGQSTAQQLAWVRSIQDSRKHVFLDPWKQVFHALGCTPEFQAVQVAHADRYYRMAVGMCQRFGLTTERALALMFDIAVQNGSIGSAAEAAIRRDFAQLPQDDEAGRLRSIANRRAETASPRFVEDVRARKLTIANGEGVVHGVHYNLEEQFGIGLRPAF